MFTLYFSVFMFCGRYKSEERRPESRMWTKNKMKSELNL